ncbi:MAG: hypothetical protein AAF125_06330 [Chloroflexota bacterium]
MPNGEDQDIYIGEPRSDFDLESIEKKRENYRGAFAIVLIVAYLLMGGYIVIGALGWETPSGGLDAAVTVLSLVGPIVGTVVGFYFGDSRKG